MDSRDAFLDDFWVLDRQDWVALEGKTGATALGFAFLLKWFRWRGRFPRSSDVPEGAVSFLGEQLGVDSAVFGGYDWSGRTIRYHREQIRIHLGFRLVSVVDEDRLTNWLAVTVAVSEFRPDVVTAALVGGRYK